MRYLAFRVAGFLTLAGAAAACLAPPALGQNVPTFSKQVVASRVWTNDDMDQLRSRGLRKLAKHVTVSLKCGCHLIRASRNDRQLVNQILGSLIVAKEFDLEKSRLKSICGQ